MRWIDGHCMDLFTINQEAMLQAISTSPTSANLETSLEVTSTIPEDDLECVVSPSTCTQQLDSHATIASNHTNSTAASACTKRPGSLNVLDRDIELPAVCHEKLQRTFINRATNNCLCIHIVYIVMSQWFKLLFSRVSLAKDKANPYKTAKSLVPLSAFPKNPVLSVGNVLRLFWVNCTHPVSRGRWPRRVAKIFARRRRRRLFLVQTKAGRFGHL